MDPDRTQIREFAEEEADERDLEGAEREKFIREYEADYWNQRADDLKDQMKYEGTWPPRGNA